MLAPIILNLAVIEASHSSYLLLLNGLKPELVVLLGGFHLSALRSTRALAPRGKEGQGLCNIRITILFVNMFTRFETNSLN